MNSPRVARCDNISSQQGQHWSEVKIGQHVSLTVTAWAGNNTAANTEKHKYQGELSTAISLLVLGPLNLLDVPDLWLLYLYSCLELR